MCGIFGFNWEDDTALKKATTEISHRGPDSKGYFLDKNISLGHRRLSIIDLDKRADQPMRYKNLVMIYNGEIYNFKEIRKKLEEKGIKFDTTSDTEVLLKAYYVFKEKVLELLNGMFAFAIYDEDEKSLFIARDRLGIKPLYYYQKENSFVFGSEIKALLKLEINTELAYEAINQYFISRYMPKEGTQFKYIKKLKPGHYLKFKDNKIEIKKYWSPEINEEEKDEERNKKTILNLFSDSVKKRLISDVPVGIFLSGGLDSSAIVSLIHESGVKDINTFTVNFGEENSEAKYARIIAEKYNTNHKEINVKTDSIKILQKVAYSLDEPLGDNATLSTYNMAKETSKHVKVVLSGEGSDELFGGYQKYKIFWAKKYLPPLGFTPHKRLNSLMKKNDSKSYAEFTSVFDDKERKELYKHYTKIDYQKYPFTNRRLNSMIKIDMDSWLPNDLLLKNDRMTMAHGLEGRVPFLDHRLVEFALKIPENQKIGLFKNKHIYREAVKKKIPKEICERKKQGFTIPLESWKKQGIIEYTEDLIKENDIKFLNKQMQLNVVKNPTKNTFVTRQFWTLLMFNQWYKEYGNHLNKTQEINPNNKK